MPQPKLQTSMPADSSPETRLCFVGPMVGRHPGMVTTQGEILAHLLQAAGHPLVSVSSERNRYRRLLDIAGTLVRQRRDIGLQCVQVYGGSSFVVEDMASWLGRRFGHRIVMHLHGGAMPEFMARYPNWTRRVLRRADAIVTPSQFLARAVVPYGFHAQVIPNVLDLSQYPWRHREKIQPRLFWMRTFHPIWNPEMAVRVLARLRAQFPDATLVMAGEDKGMRPAVEQLARSLGVHSAVRFPGFLNMEGKTREGGAADIFINTNRVDNMPVAVLEACAMGLPVVSTDVGGIPDLLKDGETGLLVRNEDEAGMAAAIARLVLEPPLAGRLSANGRRLAEKSAWPSVRVQWEKLFAGVMAGKTFNRKEECACAVLQG